jgi:Tfp pilus assembly protein PilN
VRPVNLIPPEERRGDRAPSRTGSFPQLIVVALALVLAGVTGVVLTNNQISDREADVATLEAREAETQARAEALRPYAEFASVQEARQATVTSLAQSRFDWERVLRELAIVLPNDIWLTKLSGTVGPQVQLDQAAATSIGEDVAGPALQMVGCGASHEAVARFIEALRDIDGVTRVGLGKSTRPDQADGGAVSGGTDEDCRTREFITQFEIVAAFDGVAVAPVEAPAPVTPTPASTGDEAAVASAQQQEQEARDSTAEQTRRSRNAANLIPGAVK